MTKKKLCFDLVGTICTNTFGDYHNAKPYIKVIKKVNQLYEDGHEIIIFTARFMGKNNGNINDAYSEGYLFTKNQITDWGLKFHKLILGKPEYDLVIDDKSIFFNEQWYEDFYL